VKYYNRSELKEKFTELESIKDKSTYEYFFKYMKVVYSFGKDKRLTQSGIDKGRELHERWLKGEKLGREDMLLLGFLLSDICILEESSKKMSDVKTIYYQTMTTWKPDFDYMHNFANTIIPNKGYSELNKEYMPTIEKMYLNDNVFSDPEQMTMITTGEMPLDKIKVCPYCGKGFSESNVEDLFKHVKDKHGKK